MAVVRKRGKGSSCRCRWAGVPANADGRYRGRGRGGGGGGGGGGVPADRGSGRISAPATVERKWERETYCRTAGVCVVHKTENEH